jgi:hypothetical protein
MSRPSYMPFPELGKTARAKYGSQERNAAIRGIEWTFTFESWSAVWAASGKWHLRGRGRDQCVMARNRDAGPYEPGNVYITTNAENMKDYYAYSGRVRRPQVPVGKGKGWTMHKGCKSRPYSSRFRKQHLGMFATAEDARLAYLAAFDAYLAGSEQ